MGSQRRRPLRLLRSAAERRASDVHASTPLAGELRAALTLVASRSATSVTLCGFGDGPTDLRAVLTDSLDLDGVLIEPVVRPAGGGFDIRVRRSEATGS